MFLIEILNRVPNRYPNSVDIRVGGPMRRSMRSLSSIDLLMVLLISPNRILISYMMGYGRGGDRDSSTNRSSWGTEGASLSAC